MVKIVLHVEGMACGMCEAHVNEAVRKAQRSHRSNRLSGIGYPYRTL